MITDSDSHPFSEFFHDGRPVTKRMISARDCNPYGFLNNSSFLDYVIDARHEALVSQYNIGAVDHHHDGGTMFVVVSHQTSYLELAKAHEEVLISTSAIFADAENMLVEGAMTSADGRRLKFHQWTRLKVLDPKIGTAAPTAQHEVCEQLPANTRPNITDPNNYQGRVNAITRFLELQLH